MIFFPSVRALTLLVGRHEGYPACKKLGVDFFGGGDLTGALHDFIAPVVITTSTILCFNKHWLTQVHLEKAGKMERDREREGESMVDLVKIILSQFDHQANLVTVSRTMCMYVRNPQNL